MVNAVLLNNIDHRDLRVDDTQLPSAGFGLSGMSLGAVSIDSLGFPAAAQAISICEGLVLAQGVGREAGPRRVGLLRCRPEPREVQARDVDRGHARMRILDPDGSLDEYELNPGDVYFVPRAYPHHIENIGRDDWHFLIFFDQPFPADIGYRASASA